MLDERQRRLYAGLESLRHGRGGDSRVAAQLGMAPATVAKGRQQLLSGDYEAERTRKPGGGRKALEKKPALTVQLVHLLRHDTAGDPCSDPRWTRRTTRNLADYLTDVLQLPVSPRTVARLLRTLGHSLRVNHKCIPSSSPAERNEQFEFIDQLRRDYAARNTPILSIDTKKNLIPYLPHP